LVVGGAGYIGSTVVFRALTTANFKVKVFDKLMYGGSSTFPFFSMEDRFEFIYGDARTANWDEILKGVDFVFNAAALVGEHICKKYPQDAEEINQEAAIQLADACNRNGVKRYIFASTCSIYGKTEEMVDESAPVLPLSLYAGTKINVENYLTQCTGGPCKMTVVRFATIYGLACRVRFDLLVHEFIRDAWNNKEIEIYGPDGWRPFLHVDDGARAVVMLLQQSDKLPGNQIYNIGGDDQNIQKKALGEMIAGRLDCKLALNHKSLDKRSYQVGQTPPSHPLIIAPSAASPPSPSTKLQQPSCYLPSDRGPIRGPNPDLARPRPRPPSPPPLSPRRRRPRPSQVSFKKIREAVGFVPEHSLGGSINILCQVRAGAWVHGCMGAWVHGCMGAWVPTSCRHSRRSLPAAPSPLPPHRSLPAAAAAAAAATAAAALPRAWSAGSSRRSSWRRA
jgi:nucleoside-diphosphate-sugar epimerase